MMKSKYLYILREILVNFIGYKFGLRRLIGRGSVANVSRNLEVDLVDKGYKHLDLIESIFRKYNIDVAKERMLEMGPGGTQLHGLLQLTKPQGWKEYIGVDVYRSEVWSDYPQKLYKMAIKTMDNSIGLFAQKIVDDSSMGKGPIKYFGSGGVNGEELNEYVSRGSVDLIYSWGVLEHVDSPLEVFQKNFEHLKKGGVAIHVIDTHPHTWNRFSKCPYIFLTIPDWLWNLMYAGRGFLNRYRASQFIEWAKDSGFKVTEVKREVNSEDVMPKKKDMLPRFCNLDNKDILTDRLYLLLTKKI